ncbi:MAG: hypothetical protein Q9174_001324 [Haloplaca sp. 1 TL-2023]
MSTTVQLPSEDDVRFQELIRYLHVDHRVRTAYVVLITVINKSTGEEEEINTGKKVLDPQAANVCASEYILQIGCTFGRVCKSGYEEWKLLQVGKAAVKEALATCREGFGEPFNFTFRGVGPNEGFWFKVWVQVRKERRWLSSKEQVQWDSQIQWVKETQKENMVLWKSNGKQGVVTAKRTGAEKKPVMMEVLGPSDELRCLHELFDGGHV